MVCFVITEYVTLWSGHGNESYLHVHGNTIQSILNNERTERTRSIVD